MRAALQIIRFLHKTCKTRTLHRAAATILYVARLLKAQNGFGWRARSSVFVWFVHRDGGDSVVSVRMLRRNWLHCNGMPGLVDEMLIVLHRKFEKD